MANPQLADALPEVGGVRVANVAYDSNESYPLATPPADVPCLAVIHDGAQVYDIYLYIEVVGQVVPLAINFYAPGGS
jgi:hypothetical protein